MFSSEAPESRVHLLAGAVFLCTHAVLMLGSLSPCHKTAATHCLADVPKEYHTAAHPFEARARNHSSFVRASS